MDLLNRYHLYLYALGYSIKSVTDKHSSIQDYINAVSYVAELENKTVDELAANIKTLFLKYDKGGEKFATLPQNNNNRTSNGLKHFKEFIEFCNKI